MTFELAIVLAWPLAVLSLALAATYMVGWFSARRDIERSGGASAHARKQEGKLRFDLTVEENVALAANSDNATRRLDLPALIAKIRSSETGTLRQHEVAQAYVQETTVIATTPVFSTEEMQLIMEALRRLREESEAARQTQTR